MRYLFVIWGFAAVAVCLSAWLHWDAWTECRRDHGRAYCYIWLVR